jgi:hypothetical protein
MYSMSSRTPESPPRAGIRAHHATEDLCEMGLVSKPAFESNIRQRPIFEKHQLLRALVHTG